MNTQLLNPCAVESAAIPRSHSAVNTLGLVAVGPDSERSSLQRQLAELGKLSGITRVGLLILPGCSPALEQAVIKGCRVDVVERGEMSQSITQYRLRRRLRSTECAVLVCEGRLVLSAASLRNFLAFHETSSSGQSIFTPGVHESWRAREVAAIWDVDRFPSRLQPSLILQSAVPRLKTWFALMPASLQEKVRRLVRMVRNMAAFRARSASGGKPEEPAVPGETKNGRSGIYLGTVDDQLELLGDRAGELYPFPSVVNLVLTNLCNLSCVMCPYHSPLYEDQSGYFDKNKYMSDDVFERVAREAAAHGAVLKLGQLEEVFMHPRLLVWIKRASALGVRHIHITTNGTLMTPERAEALVQSGVTSLYVSLDAATPDTYKKIRGGDLDKVCANVDALLDSRRRAGSDMRIYTSMILQQEAIAEKDDFIGQWRAKGIDGVIIYQLSEHFSGVNNFAGKNFSHAAPEQRHACSSVWQEAYVYPDGEVSMCCTTMILVPQKGLISVGNVNEQSLQDIWLGRQYRDLRKRLIRNDIEGDVACKDCDIWHACETRTEQADGYRLEMNPTCAIHHFR
jgi:radical SAM protein with 4Fe4S-binding SPASM domain